MVHKHKKTGAGLILAALGIVFGDIGTSPLYALHALFGPVGQHLAINQTNVYGIISIIIWSITFVVSIKYLALVMRADNHGEGGIMALVALIKSGDLDKRYKWLFITIGLIGVSLFYGDSAITPAISVLSAVEGLKVITPHATDAVLPITLGVLLFLFWIQRYGTALIGRLFGPIMVVWFTGIGLAGCWRIAQHPDILRALSPFEAIGFFVSHPLVAFVAMGAIVLVITGAEALYADMGHFGRRPIAWAWFLLVFPALLLCYMGQGTLILHQPAAASNPFFLLFPDQLRIVMIFVATAATLIASQAVISGAFSLTRQAIQLGFLPKLQILHTSVQEAGQIYVPFVNFLLGIVVTLLVIGFGSSARLANVYGVAVSGTLLTDSLLFIVAIRSLWHSKLITILLVAISFLAVDILFLSSNIAKILHGGWLPISIGGLLFIIINTWVRGESILHKQRQNLEGPIQDFTHALHKQKPALTRVPGQAVFIGHHPGFTPLALRTAVEDLHELPEKVVILYVETSTAAHVPEAKRVEFNDLGYNDGISELRLHYGYHDSPHIPQTLQTLRHLSPELDFDPSQATYFISLTKVVPTKRHNLAGWRKALFALMSQNSLSRSDYYNLPTDKTLEMRTLIEL